MKGSRRIRINKILEDVHKQLCDLNAIQNNDLWDAYAKLEYAILLVKLDDNFETAGGFQYSRFNKISETEIHKLATNHLQRGMKSFNKGNVKMAIDDLRKARDALKLLVLKH